jgi:hypothetical protein
MDRSVASSQPRSRTQSTMLVGCVVAVAAVFGAGVVGETTSTLRSARKTENDPAVLALKTIRSKPKPAVKSNVNAGSATQIVADATINVDPTLNSARINEAMDSLTVDWRAIATGWTISFKKERNGYLGLTYVRERKIEIYVRRDRTVEGLAHDIAHELGHVADVTAGTDETRSAYLFARGLAETTPWWTCSGCTDLQVGAGDFAETFALLIAPRYKFYSELGERPGPLQLNAVLASLPTSVRLAMTANRSTQA